MMLIILILANIWLAKFYVNMQACSNTVPVPCTAQSNRVIYVNGVVPTGSCMAVQVDATNITYDPIMINTVWVAVVNTDNICPQSLTTKAQNLANSLNLINQEIIILYITPQYLRMVIVPKGCTNNCVANQFISNLEAFPTLITNTLYPNYYDLNQVGPYCLNGGKLDPNYKGAGYNCSCPGGVSVFNGPSCEYMERTINTRQVFLNVFRNAARINIRFSFFSNGIIGNQILLTIKNAIYSKIVEISIIESTVYLTVYTNSISISQAIDTQKWYDFSIVVTTQNATLTVGSNSKYLNFTNTASVNFMSHFFILNDNSNSTNKICVKNLIVNSRIIDLNGNQYASCCSGRCAGYPYPQLCDCYPFISQSFTNAYCPPGYTKSGTTCIPNGVTSSQISNGVGSQLTLANTNVQTLDFGFQTLSVNGQLVTVNLLTPPISLVIQIVNSNLTLNVPNQTLRTLNYNVSNGIIHTVTVMFTTYSLGLILDNNANYSINMLNWYTATQPIPTITATSLVIGVMLQPFSNPLNTLTTCISAMQLNTVSSPIILNPGAQLNMAPQCSTGPRCSSVNCTYGTTCNDSLWQNTQCVSNCPSNYTFTNGVCICATNKCMSGVCYFNVSVGNYSCNCTAGYTGYNCDIPPISNAGLWYIAVIVVLLLLLIILIALLVYCFCFAARRPANEQFITKINENIVVYNDQAGESDYNGPPINFAIMKNALNNGPNPTIKAIPIANLMSKKDGFDKDNKDLILDYPLEYGFEGFESDYESMSSIGSKSAASEVDFAEMDITFDGIGDK